MPSDPAPPDPPPPPTEGPKPTPRKRTGTARGKKAGKTWFPVITKNRMFAGLVLFVAGFAIAGFVGRVVLGFAGKDPPNQFQADLGRICDYMITAGLSSLIGLLGGRAAAPDSLEAGPRK